MNLLTVPLVFPIKYVYQTRFGVPDGNCLAACVSSITGINLEEIDKVIGKLEHWDGGDTIIEYLREKGWLWTWFPFTESMKCTLPFPHILTGTTMSGLPHCVVSMNGKVIHNPNKRPDSQLVSVNCIDVLLHAKPLQMVYSKLPSIEESIMLTNKNNLHLPQD